MRLLQFCERLFNNPQLWPNIRPEAFRAFSVIWTFQCFDLILLHELAHLLLGHVADDAKEAKRDPRVLQALEFAADGHAAIWGFEMLRALEQVYPTHRNAVAEGYHEFHRTRHDTLANYLLTLFFMFRIADERVPRDGENLANARHPPASMRFNVASIHLAEHFKHTGDAESLQQLERADTWERGEEIFAKLLDREPEPRLKRWTLSEESEQHYNRISDLARTMPRHWFGLVD